jgi:hypothetical protein
MNTVRVEKIAIARRKRTYRCFLGNYRQSAQGHSVVAWFCQTSILRGKGGKLKKWFCFVFNARRAGKEILKDQGCLADEWTAGKCAATLHA